jgi:hypothetical protein
MSACCYQAIASMRHVFPLFRILALFLAPLCQSQTNGSMFLRGQLETHDSLVTKALDSNHSLKITNPEAVRGEENRKLILHGVSTDEGFRVISFATFDDHDIPEDFSFAAIVAQRTDAKMDTSTFCNSGRIPMQRLRKASQRLFRQCIWQRVL